MTDPATPDLPAPKSPRVLVVDADAVLFGLIEQWLQPAGCEVLAAAVAGGAAVDLVIADLPFPRREAVEALRAQFAGPVPILVLSSAVFESVDCCGPAARALAVDGLLPKPTTGDALLRAVRRLTAR